MSDSKLRTADDLLSRRFAPWLAYGLPSLVIFVTLSLGSPQTLITVTWTAAFLVMGVACLINARRCQRVHCWFTGPFFLALSLASLAHGLGLLPLGQAGWGRLLWVFGVGAGVLYFIPEWIWGRYFRRS